MTMTLILHSPSRRPSTARSFRDLATTVGHALWRPVQAALDRRALGRLMALDDRMLSDIGVTRTDVQSALVADGELASEALAHRAEERRRADGARARAAARTGR
jgi:uncharacterized protein YjiS (DUF1127 family)